jgi:hypothetical protein
MEAMKPSCTNSYAQRGQRTIAQPFENGHDEWHVASSNSRLQRGHS